MLREDTAVVLIECQNEFCSVDGVLHQAVKDVVTENNVLENIKDLLASVRGKCKVIHVPIFFAGGYPEIGKAPYGILKGVVENKAFLKGGKGADFYPAFEPQEGEIVAEGKKTLSAFGSSNLNYILRSNDIKRIALVGFLTNVCVEATARSAYDLGYEVIILSDCTAATTQEEQKFAVEKIFPLFAKVMCSEEFVESLTKDAQTVEVAERSYYQ